MAYEVARVHGLIRSHIREGDKEPDAEVWPLPRSKFMASKPSPDNLLVDDLPSDSNQWSESAHSSSLESSTETETESDEEDDLMAGLAEQIAHSMLDEDEPANSTGTAEASPEESAGCIPVFSSRFDVACHKQVSVSPQSSWSTNSWSASWSDSVSSSKQSSEVSSPPSTPSTSENDAWELLNAAAGEVVRLKMDEERRLSSLASRNPKPTSGTAQEGQRHCAVYPEPRTQWKSHVVPLLSNPACNAYAPVAPPTSGPKDRPGNAGPPHLQRAWNRARDDDRKPCSQPQVQHRLSRNEGHGWNQRQNRSGHSSKGNAHPKGGRQNHFFGGHSRMGGKTPEWNGGPQWAAGQGVNGGSGMRAVFLGSGGSGRESGGTGVFLPRCIGGVSDNRRKPACSTVLLPSRIVQVLNLNVEDMRSHPSPLTQSSAHSRSDYGTGLQPAAHMYMMELTPNTPKYENGDLTSYSRRHQSHIRQSESPVEFSLPTEWTY